MVISPPNGSQSFISPKASSRLSKLSLPVSFGTPVSSYGASAPPPVRPNGTVFIALAASCPSAPTIVLEAMIPPDLDLDDVENLTPSPQADLYFKGAHSVDNSPSAVVKVGLAFSHPCVVLDHTNYLINVYCDGSNIRVAFNDKSAYQKCESEWQIDEPVILIISDKRRGADGTPMTFLANSFKFDQETLTAVGWGRKVQSADVVDTIDLKFGTIARSNMTLDCSSMTVLPPVLCDNPLDLTFRQKPGCYGSQTGVTRTALVPITPIKGISQTMTQAAQKGLPTIITDAVSSIANTVKTFVQSFGLSIPEVTLSQSYDLPVDLGPAQNDLSPWGDQHELYAYPSRANEDAAIDTSAQDSPNAMANQLSMYLIDCGMKGDFQTIGTISASLAQGITRCDISLTGSLSLGFFVGMHAFAACEGHVQKDLINREFPTLNIPGIAVLGPKVIVSMKSKFNVQTAGKMLVGASIKWPAIDVQLDLVDGTQSTGSGLVPNISKRFDASGEIAVAADFSLPLALFFGIDLLGGKYSKSISLVDIPACSTTVDLAMTSSEASRSISCLGSKYNLGLSNDLSMNVLDVSTYTLASYSKPNLVSGSFDLEVPALTRATSSLLLPSPVLMLEDSCYGHGRSKSTSALIPAPLTMPATLPSTEMRPMALVLAAKTCQ